MVIGITGSIASGKSVITSYLKNHGYNIVDCDEISHDVLGIEEVKNLLRKNFLSRRLW